MGQVMNCDECGKELHPMSARKTVSFYLRSANCQVQMHEHCFLALVRKLCNLQITMKEPK
jgi:methionyl-tRNA synthetase